MYIDESSFKGNVFVKVDGVMVDKPLKDLESAGYRVNSVYAKDNTTVVELVTVIQNDMNANWVNEYTEKYGVEPNIFEG